LWLCPMKSHDVAVIETTALSVPHPSEEIRSDAGSIPACGRRHPYLFRGATRQGRSDALKWNRALGCDANVAWPGPRSSGLQDGPGEGPAAVPIPVSKGL